ncbi:MAG TPA: PIN domain-containing protein [Terriglobia bacterium]|nr:PIN domain-containing protein [Terriglobia bacterium]
MIFDSDVLIEFLAKNPAAAERISSISHQDRNLSVISYLEVLYGCRNKQELQEFQQFIAATFAEVIPLNESVSTNAIHLMEKHVLARRLDAADALIAATALDRGEAVTTCNAKHFAFIPGLQLEIFRP